MYQFVRMRNELNELYNVHSQSVSSSKSFFSRALWWVRWPVCMHYGYQRDGFYRILTVPRSLTRIRTPPSRQQSHAHNAHHGERRQKHPTLAPMAHCNRRTVPPPCTTATVLRCLNVGLRQMTVKSVLVSLNLVLQFRHSRPMADANSLLQSACAVGERPKDPTFDGQSSRARTPSPFCFYTGGRVTPPSPHQDKGRPPRAVLTHAPPTAGSQRPPTTPPQPAKIAARADGNTTAATPSATAAAHVDAAQPLTTTPPWRIGGLYGPRATGAASAAMAVTGAHTDAGAATPVVTPAGRAVGEAALPPVGAPPVPPTSTDGDGEGATKSNKPPTSTMAGAVRQLAVAAHAPDGGTADAPHATGRTRP